MVPKVKICCIASLEEASLALSYGASALGLVGAMPSGPGVISDDEIFQIATAVPSSVATFLLTSETEAEGIIAHHARANTNTIQLVDTVEENAYIEIKKALPGIRLVQVIHVIGEHSIDEAVMAAEYADAILLDSGNPHLAVKELGGTGRVHDWRLSRRIRESIYKPLYLAGGLRPDNVRYAIEAVEPYGLDLCSGVRTDGKLDERKLEAFFKAVQSL